MLWNSNHLPRAQTAVADSSSSLSAELEVAALDFTAPSLRRSAAGLPGYFGRAGTPLSQRVRTRPVFRVQVAGSAHLWVRQHEGAAKTRTTRPTDFRILGVFLCPPRAFP